MNVCGCVWRKAISDGGARRCNRQGRARASLAKLYNWRYDNLQNLPRVQQLDSFHHANAGFAHEYQFIDVPDWDGVGESEPTPYFYQNLGTPPQSGVESGRTVCLFGSPSTLRSTIRVGLGLSTAPCPQPRTLRLAPLITRGWSPGCL